MKPIYNRYARSQYEFLESWEAGLVLTGAEVKSIKKGQMQLTSAYVGFEEQELWLKNAHISPYQIANQPGYDIERPRKVLLRKAELQTIIDKLQTKGLTLVPEQVYSKHGIIKIRITLARGLKVHDKRQKLKKQAIDRQVAHMLKKSNY